MPKPNKEWKVLPHGALSRIGSNLVTVTGKLHMPLGDYPRRMTVVRLTDGRLVVYSAIALEESEMAELEAWGRPALLVVPGDIHRLDAHPWKVRYPSMIVVAPPGARSAVEEVVPVDATAIDFDDPRVQFVVVAGTGGHEAALVVHDPPSATLVVNDLIWNLEDRPGFGGWIMHALGFTGGDARIPPLVRRKVVDDRAALRAQLEDWSRIAGLERILVGHGDPIVREPRAVLKRMAHRLG
jgi:hypothetical protein